MTSNTGGPAPMSVEGPARNQRSKSLSALFFSNQQKQKFTGGGPALLETDEDSVTLPAITVNAPDAGSTAAAPAAGDAPSSGGGGMLGIGGMFSRRTSMFTRPEEVAKQQEEPRRKSDSTLWSWLTTPTPGASGAQPAKTGEVGASVTDSSAPGLAPGSSTTGGLAAAAAKPPVAAADGGKFNLLQKITTRDINAVSPSNW